MYEKYLDMHFLLRSSFNMMPCLMDVEYCISCPVDLRIVSTRLKFSKEAWRSRIKMIVAATKEVDSSTREVLLQVIIFEV
jgi:ribosomal protein S26